MKVLKNQELLKRLVILVLAASVLILAMFVLADAAKDLRQVWKVLPYPGDWRGARFAADEEFADYLAFFRAMLPENATLGLPPTEGASRALSNTPLMQFFLAPRQVVNCTRQNPGCPAALIEQGAFLVVLGNGTFPPQEFLNSPGRIRMFNQKWGILLPPETAANPINPAPPALFSLKAVFSQVVMTVFCLLLLAASGAALTGYWMPGLGFPSRLSLGFGLGIGWLSISLYLYLLSGAWLAFPAVTVSFSAWILAGASFTVLNLRRSRKTAGQVRLRPRQIAAQSTRAALRYLPFLALAAVSAFLAFGTGYHASDEMFIWGAKGVGIALDGLPQGVTDWGTQTTQYPLLVPLWIALVKAVSGDLVAQSKLVFSFFYLGLLVLVFDFLMLRLNRWVSLLACLALALSPLIFRHAALAYANLPLTYFLISSALLILYAQENMLIGNIRGKTATEVPELPGDFQSGSRFAVLTFAGLFLGLSAWTRPEGLVLSLLVAFSALVIFGKTWRNGHFWRSVSLLLLPIVILELLKLHRFLGSADSWDVPGRLGLSPLLAAAFQSFRAGNWHIPQTGFLVVYLAGQALHLPTWGVLAPFFLLFIFIAILTGKPDRSVKFLILSGCLAGLSIFGLYFLLSFDSVHDISWWAATGLNRMLMPAIVLLWIGTASALSRWLPVR